MSAPVDTSPFTQLRRDILNGVFAPGDPLRLSALSKRYDVSATPLREALSRLEEKQLVTASPNRGWRVAPISLEHLEDIVEARITLELVLLEQSIARGGVDWEAGIVAAHHRLAQTPPPRGPGARAQREAWADAHDAFHRALLAAGKSERLRAVYAEIIEQLQRYHDALLYHHDQLMSGVEGENAPVRLDVVHSAPQHAELMKAALDRDTPRALALMREHVEHTLVVYRSVTGGLDTIERKQGERT